MPMELAAEQESVATACETKFGTAARQLVLEETVRFPGQESVGGVRSRTVTTTVASEDAPQGSETLRVTTLVPRLRSSIQSEVSPSEYLRYNNTLHKHFHHGDHSHHEEKTKNLSTDFTDYTD